MRAHQDNLTDSQAVENTHASNLNRTTIQHPVYAPHVPLPSVTYTQPEIQLNLGNSSAAHTQIHNTPPSTQSLIARSQIQDPFYAPEVILPRVTYAQPEPHSTMGNLLAHPLTQIHHNTFPSRSSLNTPNQSGVYNTLFMRREMPPFNPINQLTSQASQTTEDFVPSTHVTHNNDNNQVPPPPMKIKKQKRVLDKDRKIKNEPASLVGVTDETLISIHTGQPLTTEKYDAKTKTYYCGNGISGKAVTYAYWLSDAIWVHAEPEDDCMVYASLENYPKPGQEPPAGIITYTNYRKKHLVEEHHKKKSRSDNPFADIRTIASKRGRTDAKLTDHEKWNLYCGEEKLNEKEILPVDLLENYLAVLESRKLRENIEPFYKKASKLQTYLKNIKIISVDLERKIIIKLIVLRRDRMTNHAEEVFKCLSVNSMQELRQINEEYKSNGPERYEEIKKYLNKLNPQQNRGSNRESAVVMNNNSNNTSNAPQENSDRSASSAASNVSFWSQPERQFITSEKQTFPSSQNGNPLI